ncbi:YhhN family protein [Paenibacillus curdlanolyticus YK9]|uniref:YhhN family protein n=1 Tax=Paenibacillus curdlanolyticus YK9 TaxID=717606 RepID=E0IG26_9BACL|nr:lysoplasmalogenase [Paenibacillus curdlanolyticus]EFM08606.1 YhhN family protein [Paenibacillus curdlanolyticus YK9]
MTLKFALPALILLTSALYMFIIPAEPHAVKLLFKLIPMWLMISYAYLNSPDNSNRFHWFTQIGLIFCMLGDGLLGWFVIGLSAFLIGHLFYMSGFLGQWRFSKLRAATLIPIAAYAVFMSTQLVQSLIQDNKQELIIPVLLYITVIGLMTWSAIMTGRLWATVGAVLFMISDSFLSWNLFVSEIQYAGTLIMTTYYTAQFCIARNLRPLPVETNESIESPTVAG